MQKNARPIREAVVNLATDHTMDDLKGLAKELEHHFRIKTFQIHIHRDEGKSKDQLNYHAHMVLDWQDKEKGTMLRLNKLQMSQIQTLVSETLGLERGKLNSKAIRLEAQEYKTTQEIKKLTQEKASKTQEIKLLNDRAVATAEKKTLQKDLSLNKKELITSEFLKRKLSRLYEQTRTLSNSLQRQKERNFGIKTNSVYLGLVKELKTQKTRNLGLRIKLKSLKTKYKNLKANALKKPIIKTNVKLNKPFGAKERLKRSKLTEKEVKSFGR